MNSTAVAAIEDATLHAQASYLRDALKAERWSGRQVALQTGIGRNRIYAILEGASYPATVSEVASIAPLLHKTPAELFTALLAVSGDEPTPHGGASTRSNIVFPDFAGDRTGAKIQGYLPNRGGAPVVPLFATGTGL